jgi:DnaK suppressor protein
MVEVESDMLSEETLRQFEHELVQSRSRLLAAIADESAEHKILDLERARFARLPRSDADATPGSFSPSREQAEVELKRIDAALGRMQRRRFGACCRCNCEIDRERLTADPATPFCQDCFEELAEQRQKALKVRR